MHNDSSHYSHVYIQSTAMASNPAQRTWSYRHKLQGEALSITPNNHFTVVECMTPVLEFNLHKRHIRQIPRKPPNVELSTIAQWSLKPPKLYIKVDHHTQQVAVRTYTRPNQLYGAVIHLQFGEHDTDATIYIDTESSSICTTPNLALTLTRQEDILAPSNPPNAQPWATTANTTLLMEPVSCNIFIKGRREGLDANAKPTWKWIQQPATEWHRYEPAVAEPWTTAAEDQSILRVSLQDRNVTALTFGQGFPNESLHKVHQLGRQLKNFYVHTNYTQGSLTLATYSGSNLDNRTNIPLLPPDAQPNAKIDALYFDLSSQTVYAEDHVPSLGETVRQWIPSLTTQSTQTNRVLTTQPVTSQAQTWAEYMSSFVPSYCQIL